MATTNNTTFAGLTARQVALSRQLHGSNVLTPPRRVPLWRQYVARFADPIIIILLVAGLLSLAGACYEYYYTAAGRLVFFSPIGIFIAVLLSTGVAFYFEWRANREFTLLSRVSDDEQVAVYRDGQATMVARRDIVVGDIVVLPTGMEVPADGELLMADDGMLVDEASLTGEALCRKTTVAARYDPEATYPSNHVLRGTKVMAGQGVMRVLAVGDSTESGRLKQALSLDDSVQTPLNEQLSRLAHWMTRGGYIMALVIIVAKLLWIGTVVGPSLPLLHVVLYVLQTVMIAVTVVVIIVPEGLPMAVTLSLAYSMRRMFKTNNLVRRLHACETMGATTVICTDKTGTLTETALYDKEAMTSSEVLRDGVPAAIAACQRAGIEVKMVTGDSTARAIEVARAAGLLAAASGDGCVLTGQEMALLSDEALRSRLDEVKIIARARPMDKKRLVEVLQTKGHIVAVTGDGTNDAPALQAAHVGISMGSGTDVAKNASDITILDNSFVSICRAVMWGRSLYQNIQRFLLFQLTVNVTACLLVLVGAFFGTAAPLTVAQMLWVNIIMDTFGAMALASLPPSPRVLRDKPRRREAFVVTRNMLTNICGVGLLFFAVLLALLYIFYHADITCLGDLCHLHLAARGEVTPYEQTLLFSVFVWLHFWYLFAARTYGTHRSLFALPLRREFVAIVVLIVAGQLCIVEGAYNFFDVVPLLHSTTATGIALNVQGATDFIAIVVLTSAVLWLREAWCLTKRLLRR